ncbi:MAG: succinyl-CoA synthetase subunit alpha [Candidatus Cloacimonetes bacterium]|nr:succinyl-CoA synthetase subunit alpha [Candidatus Cloacimonadota bacterium]
MKKVKPTSNYEYFLQLDTSPYEGQWIAIAENKVVAVNSRADETYKIAKSKYPQSKISLSKVPQHETLVLKIKTK